MWTTENNRVKLDISKIRSDFKIATQDGLTLVCPKKNLWDWEEDEKWLRSVVVDNNGFVVSCSWKKFGNYGEFVTDTSSLDHALASNRPVIFSHKEDGSLAIRSIIDGRVIFRTRGTMFGGEATDDEPSFGERFKLVATQKYPKLLDNTWLTDRSLLFEYVAPSNTIVVRYKSEDLIFLGFVMHNDLRIGEWEELEEVADVGNLNLVRLHELPSDPIKLIEEVKVWKDEGVVVRCEDQKGNPDQNFVKIKSAHYLANHRMKFSMRYPTIVEFVESANIKNESQLVTELQACDYDWEIIESAKEFYEQYLSFCQAWVVLLGSATILANEFFTEHPDADRTDPAVRKEFAKVACSQKGLIRTIMFCIYDDKNDRLHALSRKFILLKGKK